MQHRNGLLSPAGLIFSWETTISFHPGAGYRTRSFFFFFFGLTATFASFRTSPCGQNPSRQILGTKYTYGYTQSLRDPQPWRPRSCASTPLSNTPSSPPSLAAPIHRDIITTMRIPPPKPRDCPPPPQNANLAKIKKVRSCERLWI